MYKILVADSDVYYASAIAKIADKSEQKIKVLDMLFPAARQFGKQRN